MPFSATERDSGSVYTYDTPPEKSRVTSRGQFSSTSTNVVIPTIPPQYSKGLRENYMRHLWETMSGSGDSGTGTKPTPCHIHQNPPRHIPAKRTQPAQPHPPYPTTNHTLYTQQAPRPRPPSDLPTFTNLHATHGYTTLPGPHQTPRPRIRTTHALKTQTTSPKTLQIHSISPKWSALWAHTLQLEARRRRHNGCAYDLHHCGARTLHHRCEQH